MIRYPERPKGEKILIESVPIEKESLEELLEERGNFYNDDLIEFEKLNKSTSSIYDLDKYNVLIILEDGKNITSWDNISEHYYDKIKFISEDLTNQNDLSNKYNLWILKIMNLLIYLKMLKQCL